VTGPRIILARTGERDGYVVAVMPGRDRYHSGARLAVGDISRISRDDQAEKWRAWLWPSAGGVMHVSKSVDAVDARTPEQLHGRLQKRADGDGPWWGEAA